MTRFPTRVAHLLVAFNLLTQQSHAAGLRRLRNNAVPVPDLSPIKSDNRAVRDAGFEQLVEEELEEVLLDEVFRLDASMSFSMPMDQSSSSHQSSNGSSGDDEPMHAGGGGGGGGSSTGGGDQDDGSEVYKKCGMTAESRSKALLDILSTVSDLSKLEDMSTSQYKARQWLDKNDGALLCPDDSKRIAQRYTAGLIYFQFGGDNWDNCRSSNGPCYQEDSTSIPAIPFLDPSHECLWFGLSCDGVPREVLPSQRNLVGAGEYLPIISVDISDNSLSGDLFEELFGLTGLQELTLDGNKGISGTIPEAIGQLTNLIAVDIDDNFLVGSIPQSIYSLTTLEAIDLNSNSLTGTLSNEIGNLKNLVVLQLDNNELDGPMPTDGLLQLQELAVWTVLDNNLTGSTERVCAVLDERRTTNDFPGYLQFFWVDCLGNPPQVECSCCECKEPQSPTSF